MELAIFNFRDMGGLPIADGKRIKPGKLYRSSALSDDRKRALRYLESLHIDTILDLRCPEELADKPEHPPKNARHVNLPLLPDEGYSLITVSKAHTRAVLALRGEGIDEMRRQKLASYAHMPYSYPAFRELAACLDRGETILFHCTEGKDRTGVMAAAIEYCLGRTQEQIRGEFLRSNEFMKRKYRKTQLLMKLCRLDKHLQETILFAERTENCLLDQSLNAIHAKYQTLDDFLALEYAVTDKRRAHWKSIYLE